MDLTRFQNWDSNRKTIQQREKAGCKSIPIEFKIYQFQQYSGSYLYPAPGTILKKSVLLNLNPVRVKIQG
jgi:hypothetical protein